VTLVPACNANLLCFALTSMIKSYASQFYTAAMKLNVTDAVRGKTTPKQQVNVIIILFHDIA